MYKHELKKLKFLCERQQKTHSMLSLLLLTSLIILLLFLLFFNLVLFSMSYYVFDQQNSNLHDGFFFSWMDPMKKKSR